MTDFERVFRDSPRHDDILRDLIQVISKHASASIACTVSMDDDPNVNRHYILEEGIGKPYSLAARGAYMNACAWQEKYGRPGEDINLRRKLAPFMKVICKSVLLEML